jgi:hypothetical protein
MDSVYWGAFADADLGNYTDDLVGCDTLRQGGFTWNDGWDNVFGDSPPCFFIDLLQGPVVYIPGVTFTDTNGNGVYDAGIDATLDTAYNVRGRVFGKAAFAGAKNLPLSSFVNSIGSHPVRSGFNTTIATRNFMLGRLGNGEHLDPCMDPHGQVFGVPCTKIPDQFWYSGEVVAGFGWIYITPSEVRQLQSAGPFRLVKDEPIDLIIAYIVGRGVDAAASVGQAQRISDFTQRFFDSNFDPTVGVAERRAELPREFALQQNYPNPLHVSRFNPSTTIRFSLPAASPVKLKIFDAVGREMTTLVDGQLAPGVHQIEFAPKNLPGGVYFYRLQAGERRVIKKMLLLR